jgi:hypothetical protein
MELGFATNHSSQALWNEVVLAFDGESKEPYQYCGWWTANGGIVARCILECLCALGRALFGLPIS